MSSILFLFFNVYGKQLHRMCCTTIWLDMRIFIFNYYPCTPHIWCITSSYSKDFLWANFFNDSIKFNSNIFTGVSIFFTCYKFVELRLRCSKHIVYDTFIFLVTPPIRDYCNTLCIIKAWWYMVINFRTSIIQKFSSQLLTTR